MCFGKICSNFLPCLDLKPKSICIRLVVCQCRLGFQAPPVLGKLNWQFSILFRSKGHAADSRKNKKHKQHPHSPPIRKAGKGVRGPCLQRWRPLAPSDGTLHRASCPPTCFQKGQTQRGPDSCGFKLCLQCSQGEACPLMLVQNDAHSQALLLRG